MATFFPTDPTTTILPKGIFFVGVPSHGNVGQLSLDCLLASFTKLEKLHRIGSIESDYLSPISGYEKLSQSSHISIVLPIEVYSIQIEPRSTPIYFIIQRTPCHGSQSISFDKDIEDDSEKHYQFICDQYSKELYQLLSTEFQASQIIVLSGADIVGSGLEELESRRFVSTTQPLPPLSTSFFLPSRPAYSSLLDYDLPPPPLTTSTTPSPLSSTETASSSSPSSLEESSMESPLSQLPLLLELIHRSFHLLPLPSLVPPSPPPSQSSIPSSSLSVPFPALFSSLSPPPPPPSGMEIALGLFKSAIPSPSSPTQTTPVLILGKLVGEGDNLRDGADLASPLLTGLKNTSLSSSTSSSLSSVSVQIPLSVQVRMR